jgi:hypothetical protein
MSWAMVARRVDLVRAAIAMRSPASDSTTPDLVTQLQEASGLAADADGVGPQVAGKTVGEHLHGHQPPELGRGGRAGDAVEPDGLEEGDEPAGGRHVGVAGVERLDSVWLHGAC